MPLRLITLGGLQVYRDDIEQKRLLRRRLRAALLVYVAVERRVSREELTTVFWPESPTGNARHALRQCLYQLRRELTADWVGMNAHEIIADEALKADVHAFEAALETDDLETAVRLYRGPFLAGVHLVDLQPWESWVDSRRIQCARAFRQACRDRVDGLLAGGHAREAIEAAQRWVAPDPLDDEAQHRLIATLAHAGERTSAIRQFKAYERLLEAEDLRPLDETAALIERIRADAAPGPPVPPSLEERAPGRRPTWYAADAPPMRPRRRRLAAVGITAVVLVLFVAGLIRVLGRDPPAPTSSTALAVLPFSVRGDADAAYLGEGMVNLLATALDGPTVRPVDARAVFGMVAQETAVPPGVDRGERLAERLGAGLFVLGDVIQAGDVLRIEAAAYRAGGAGSPVVDAAVTGAPDAVFTLVDSLAARLLAGLGAGRDDRLVRTAAVTTASLAAFKAYLEGEAEFRAGRFERAEEAYLRAVAQDSTFAVAHYRLAVARDWGALPDAIPAARTAARHAHRLTPRDRALLEALRSYAAGDSHEAEHRYRAILARYPDDLDAQVQLAEVLFHYGRPKGQPVAEAEQAWRRVLIYEPRNPAAIIHLARLAAADARVDRLDTLLAPFDEAERMADRRLHQVATFRALAAGDSTALRPLVAQVRSWEDASAWQLVAYLTAFSGAPGPTRGLVEGSAEPHRPPSMIAEMRWAVALLHLENGQLEAARNAHAAALAAKGVTPDTWDRRVFELVTEWWMATIPLPRPDSTVERVRHDALTSVVDGWTQRSDAGPGGDDEPIWSQLWRLGLAAPGRLEALRLYTVGVLSLRLDDGAAARSASDSLAELARATRPSDWLVDASDMELRARLAWHAGHPDEALRILEGIDIGRLPLGVQNVVPFSALAHARYLRGELLVAVGREAEALEWLGGLGKLSVPESPYRALAHLRLAAIHDTLGNPTRATLHYARLADLWHAGDAVTRPFVEHARQRLAELEKSTAAHR